MKTLRDVNVKNKRILVRADFNVPLENGEIIDNFKIEAVLPTIKYLLDQNAKIILLTHLGRPNGRVVEELRVDNLAQKFSELIDRPVKKLNDCIGLEVEKEIEEMNSGQIIFLENVQFHSGEKEKSQEFIKSLAKLADVFVMEAFGQAHRDYASISGVPKEIPSCAGLLFEKEIKNLSKVLNNSEHPLTVVIGGAKISTKIRMIKNFLKKADDLILGGALANVVIAAKGFAIGKSKIEENMVEGIKKMELTNIKLHIPVDVIVSDDYSGKSFANVSPVGRTKENEIILDIGPDTIDLFKDIIKQSKTIIWNGPMGLLESERFSNGSERIAEAIANSDGFSVVGGGESIILLNRLGIKDKIDHISIGGGAMLSFLAGEKLPGIEALE
ncbi:phosphoglycerate kinase [Patescibacteria group bacterium]